MGEKHMKRKWKLNNLLILVAVLVTMLGTINVKAYVPTDDRPVISDVQCDAIGKVLGYGSTIHISCRVESKYSIKSVFARFTTTAYSVNYMDREFAVPLNYNIQTGKYEGESFPLLSNRLEGQYTLTIQAKDVNNLIRSFHLPFTAESFVFNNDCFIGKHIENTNTGRCSICNRYVQTPTILLNCSNLTLKVGEKFSGLTVTSNIPRDYILDVYSSNSYVANVSHNRTMEPWKIIISGKSSGTATITIKMFSGAQATCNVTVVDPPKPGKTTSIKLEKKNVTLHKGDSLQLKVTRTPDPAIEKITYTSSNKKVATVSSSGVIKAKKIGTAKITVKSGKKKVVCTVKVVKTPTTGIENVPVTLEIKKGKSKTIKPKLVPAAASDKITYRSSNKKIATVNAKGKIVGKKKGTATITVKAGKIKVKCKVVVK